MTRACYVFNQRTKELSPWSKADYTFDFVWKFLFGAVSTLVLLAPYSCRNSAGRRVGGEMIGHIEEAAIEAVRDRPGLKITKIRIPSGPSIKLLFLPVGEGGAMIPVPVEVNSSLGGAQFEIVGELPRTFVIRKE